MAPGLSGPCFPGLELGTPSEGVTHLRICAPPANTLSLDLWQSLSRALTYMESDGVTRVLVISSGLQRPPELAAVIAAANFRL